MDSCENMGSFCHLNIKPLDNIGTILFNKNNFTLSGNGKYKYVDGPVDLSFNIQKTILNDELLVAEDYYFLDGVVQLLAQYDNFEDINVRAEYLVTSQIVITYQNITEYWDGSSYW